MKKQYRYLLIIVAVLGLWACNKDWLETTPTENMTDAQVWESEVAALGVLSNLYARLPALANLDGNSYIRPSAPGHHWDHTLFDNAMASGGGLEFANNLTEYPYNWFGHWDYDYIYEINSAIDYCGASSLASKNVLVAELRFIRAYTYFMMAARHGGVPIITEIMEYTGDPTPLQVSRNSEAEVYDFVASEVDAILDDLDENEDSKTRANRYTALALKCRAMLYAGSIAKYNNSLTPTIASQQTALGLTPLAASEANGYFQKALETAELIISEGGYSLYNANPDPGENFYEAIINKSNNPEVIFVQDFSSTYFHPWTYFNIPRSMREDNLEGSHYNPSLGLVESYDRLDGSAGTFDVTANGDYIYYDNPEDIFANRDGRLYGTVVYAGSSFRGQEVDIMAGIKKWNGTAYETVTGESLGYILDSMPYYDGVNYALNIQTIGYDGPLSTEKCNAITGFTVRKFLDPDAGSSMRGAGSDVWWIRFRLGEIYLNAAEAAFELGDEATALTYINLLRERAGFPANSLTSLTMEKIQQERRCELAFEDHRYFDLKRWRLAHTLWDGNASTTTAQIFGLFPYKVYRPEDPDKHNKWVFEKQIPATFTQPRYFRMGNYYSSVPDEALSNNPNLVPNPFH